MQALASFAGVMRRQQRIAIADGVHIVDDFAHHPTAIAATIDALRGFYSSGRLVIVFEPRSATACRNTHQKSYPKAFDGADAIWLAPSGRRNIPPAEALDISQVVSDSRKRGLEIEAFDTMPALKEHAAKHLEAGDTIVLMSNRDMDGLHAQLSADLALRSHARRH